MDKDQLRVHPRKLTWNLTIIYLKRNIYGKSSSKAPFLGSILLFGGLAAGRKKSTAKIQFIWKLLTITMACHGSHTSPSWENRRGFEGHRMRDQPLRHSKSLW